MIAVKAAHVDYRVFPGLEIDKCRLPSSGMGREENPSVVWTFTHIAPDGRQHQWIVTRSRYWDSYGITLYPFLQHEHRPRGLGLGDSILDFNRSHPDGYYVFGIVVVPDVLLRG